MRWVADCSFGNSENFRDRKPLQELSSPGFETALITHELPSNRG